jgi:tetratricopeptide (TPR) repeat protein
MKRLFGSLILFILGISCLYAQGISYQKSLDDALALAVKNNKPVFILIDLPFPSTLPANLPANIPANAHINFNTTSGLDAKEVVDYYNKKFVNYHVNARDSAGIKIRDQYHLTRYPTYLFLDPKGQLFYKDGMNSRVPEKFMSMAGQALERFASGKTISYYAALDKQGTITQEQLKAYITLREELELYDNAGLADEYVNFLTIKSFDDYSTVLFVLKAGPLAYGKAYNLAYTNKKIIDSIFKTEPANVRSDMVNHTITNTRTEAINKKDVAMAQRAANAASVSWGKNYLQGAKASVSNMLTYYSAVKDTTRYFQQASYFYDTYYLNISADSAKKLQQKALDNVKRSINMPDSVVTHNKDNTTTQVSRIVAVHTGPENSPVASALNAAAWDFYTLGTHNSTYLIKALVWCRRAIELHPVAGYYDTMAHIMYRLNFYDEAILNQNKAIEMASGQFPPPTDLDNLKAELAKMRAHEL